MSKNETAKFKGSREAKSDAHLVNLIRRCREELQNNKPVLAHMWLTDLEKYLMEHGVTHD